MIDTVEPSDAQFTKPFQDEELERLAQYFMQQTTRRMCQQQGCLVCQQREAEVRRRVWLVFELGRLHG